MGVLGVNLLFVGITLVLNGAARLTDIPPKAVALMNAITAAVILIGSFISLAHAINTGAPDTAYADIASAMLFGFTYVFIAINNWFNLDWRPFAWFSLFVAIWAIFMMVLAAQGHAWGFVWLWFAWAAVWANGFLGTVCGWTLMDRIFPYLVIFVGLTAAFIPAMMMLTGLWTF